MKDDLISRQAAINAKQEFRNPNVVRDTEARTAYDRTYANGWNDCNSAWINAIKALPSAQPEEVIPHRNYKYLSDYWCACGWHLGKKGDVKYCADCGRKVNWDE